MKSLRVVIGLLLIVSTVSCDPAVEPPPGSDGAAEAMSFEEARGLLRTGRFDDAVDALRPFVSVPHAPTDALVAYARALLGAHRQSLAVWPLERAMQRVDAPPMVSTLYVTALVYGGAEREAVAQATRLLEQDPENRSIRELRAYAYESVLDLESAVEDVEILVAESPDQARLVERLLNLLIRIEDWDSARERIIDLRRLLQRDGVSDDARAVFCATAARFEKDRGDLDEAERALRECRVTHPSDPNIIFSLAEFLDGMERVEEATLLLEGLAVLYPGREQLRQGLASRYVRLDRYDDADALLLETARVSGRTSSWLALANSRLSAEDLEGTVEAVDRAVQVAMGVRADDPALPWRKMTPESRFGIGDVYVRARQFERASRIIESLDDEPAMGLLLRARMKLDQGDPAGALSDYQEAFKTFPSNPAARYLAGRAALELGEFDLAADLYQDALRSDAAATDAGLVLARMLLAEGRISWAIDTLSFFLSGQPDEPHAIRLLARAGASAGRHGFAEKARARLAIKLDWAGIALADQARDISILSGPEAARDYLAGSPRLEESSHFEAFSSWIALASAAGGEREARERADAVRDRESGSAGPWIVYARLLFDDQEIPLAISAMARAIELNPMIVTAHTELGEMLFAAGRIDEALVALDRARELDPLSARAFMAAANGLYEAERFDEAAKRLHELLIHHPWHGRAALQLVDISRRDDSVDEEAAYRMAKRAVRYQGISGPRAQLELARIELARGDHDEARSHFESTIQSNFDVANARHGLARSLEALGRPVEAIEQLELAIASSELEDTAAAVALLDELQSGGAVR